MTSKYLSNLVEKLCGKAEVMNFSVEETEDGGAKVSFEVDNMDNAFGFGNGDAVQVLVNGKWYTGIVKGEKKNEVEYYVDVILPDGNTSARIAKECEVRRTCLSDLI